MDYTYYEDDNDDYGEAALQQLSYDDNDAAAEEEDDYFSDEDNMELKLQMGRIMDAYEDCIIPSFDQIINYMLIIVLSCLIFRFIRYRLQHQPRTNTATAMHISSFLCGLTALYLTQQSQLALALLLLQLLTYALLRCMRKMNVRSLGTMMAVVTISAQFLYELSWRHPEAWDRIRGIQMVATMKVISLAYDIQTVTTNQQSTPSLIAYLGYIFCPATCALGPWVPYHAYLASLDISTTKQRVRTWMSQTLLNMTLSLSFLAASNCYAPLIANFSQSRGGLSLWLRYYADGLSVRCSHYFISFLSQAGLAAAGGLSLSKNSESRLLGPIVITRPWHIEFPRSLSALVRSWNVPMHDWLKKYVYQAALQRYNSHYATALLCTYFVSALLHGMHIRIYLVLLSLGAFAYVESILRVRLANILDACITSNSCNTSTSFGEKRQCTYSACLSYCYSLRHRQTWLILVFNLAFSLMAIFNLAYLGVILADDEPTTTLSVWHIVRKWNQIDYLNHYIALTAFIFYLFIS